MSLNSLPYGEMIVSAIGGGGLAKAADFLIQRVQGKATMMGAVDHAVQTAMQLVTERLERVEAQHEQCQENLQEIRDELAEAKAEIARLKAAA